MAELVRLIIVIAAIVIIKVLIKRDCLRRFDYDFHFRKGLFQLLYFFLSFSEQFLGAKGSHRTHILQLVTLIIVTLGSGIVLSILSGQHDMFRLFLSVVYRGLLALRIVVPWLDDLLVEMLVGSVVHFNHVLHVTVLVSEMVRKLLFLALHPGARLRLVIFVGGDWSVNDVLAAGFLVFSDFVVAAGHTNNLAVALLAMVVLQGGAGD